ncbi:tetratricopeptide repeat protein [Pontibacter sp. KCTC 32443]|uniref:tetratricopeptide repeat protein n=1 Tax=Pontibacter TaxID=323449 RepID=UPI00164E5272|nr:MULTISPECIES: tetratricopeptide repeat protein [Pontibacter]MBC5773811.1 tetratricopeptide repeat protein [Pontibacter sp. KCTC 32443]
MLPISNTILLLTVSLALAIPAQAQHPDDIKAIREKLQRERQQAKVATIVPAEKAEKLLELGLWQEAEQTIKSTKPTVPVILAKAKLAILQNEFEQAEKLVTQALKLQPESPEALLLKSKLQVQAWELEKAKATANQILAKAPRHESAILQVGHILMLQKKYNEALAHALKVQKYNPENAEAYLLESDVHFWNQKPELAEKPLITSLTLNPFNPDARFNYGYAIWRRVDATQLNDMAAQWELALELNPLHYVTHWHWGNGHTNLTYADYAQPEDDKVRQALQQAEKLIAENKLQEALAQASKVQQEFTQSVLPAMLRGSVYYMAFDMDRQQRLDSAQAIFQNILKHKKHYGPAHNALAAVIKQKQLPYLHNYDSLQQVIRQTIIKDPVNFARVFPDVTYYPGDEVQKMVWSQLYESIVYFPFLSRQNEKFVIPPLHHDLATAMNSPFFRQATTFDNRQWMDIRGVGSGAAAIEYVIRGSFLERNVVLHEYVHLFHGSVFTDAENRAVRRLYQNAMKENRTLDYYSANNEHEYLAQTYPAYFEPVKVHPLNHKSINTTADLKAKDPELYTFLDELVKRQRAYLAGDKQAMASNWAQVYLNLSERALANRLYDKASVLLDTALTWDANYQPALLAYAGVKQQQKKYGDAEKWLSKAESINPKYAPVYIARAEVQEAMRRDNVIEAPEALKNQVALYQKALELEDDLLTRATASMAFAKLYTSYGQIPEAIVLAEAYVKTAPTVSTYLRDRRDEALAYAHWLKGTTGKAPESEAELARLAALKPQNYELRQQYADVLAAQGNYRKAYTTLEEAQRILTASGTPRAAYMVRMANYQLALGLKDSARVTAAPLLSGKLKLRTTDNYKLVTLLARLGEVEKATTLLRQQPLPETPADMAERLTAVGILWEELDKSRRAEKSYKAALKANPYQYEARLQLADLLQRRGRNEQARKVLATTGKSEI